MTWKKGHSWYVDPDRNTARDEQIVQWLLALQEVFAWHLGVVVDGMAFKRHGDIWRLHIQGRRAHGGKHRGNVVTWFYGADPWECLWVAARDVKANQVQWHQDKYPVVSVS